MRLAIVAGSTYAQNGKLTRLELVETELDVLGQRLSEADAGFQVHLLKAERDLCLAVERLLDATAEPIEALLVYFCGYAVVSDERGPALLLDGPRLGTFPLKRLQRVVERAPSALVILDTVSAFADAQGPVEIARALGAGLAGEAGTTHALVAHRAHDADLSGRTPFISLLELVLDWQSGSNGLSAEALLAAMRAEETLFAALPAVELCSGREPFHLLTPGVAPVFSVPPPSLPPPTGDNAALRADALAQAGAHAEALAEYTAAIEQLGAGASAEHARLYVRIGVSLLAVARKADAVAYFDAALAIDPAALGAAAGLALANGRVHSELSLLCEARGEQQQALSHALIAVQSDPRSAPALRHALRLFDKCGQADGAWNAACALEVLGEADINESLLAGARRPEGLLPARDRVAPQDWTDKLFCPERNAAADELFAALDGAALEVGLETALRKRRLPALDPSTAEDPETSTATLAKTLLWTSKLLNLEVPRLHVLPELNANLLTPPARQPTLLANRALGSGLELGELAFLWGRQLAFLRPEHRLIAFYPTLPELAALVMAALSLGGVPQLPFRKLEGDAKLFARSLKRHLSSEGLDRLALAARRFPLRDAADATLSWSRAVELSASRAGLLACGSLEVASKMSERFPLAGQIEAKDQLGDLLSFSLSREYATLRERLGVKLTS